MRLQHMVYYIKTSAEFCNKITKMVVSEKWRNYKKILFLLWIWLKLIMYCLTIVLREKYKVYIVVHRGVLWLSRYDTLMTDILMTGNSLCLDWSSLQGSFCSNELGKDKKKKKIPLNVWSVED
jgi:hypothetical protein